MGIGLTVLRSGEERSGEIENLALAMATLGLFNREKIIEEIKDAIPLRGGNRQEHQVSLKARRQAQTFERGNRLSNLETVRIQSIESGDNELHS